MTFNKVKLYVMQYWSLYLTGFFIVFSIKYFYSIAGSNELQWILTPTAWWVRILSGITFEYEPYVGYINHHFRFIIAASCSGVQFLIITIATLIFSFVHRMKTVKNGFLWIGLSLTCSYLFTIFVNGFRIILSIYLPLYLNQTDDSSGWLTPERLHTIIGIIVYFTSLLIIYHIAEHISQKIANRLTKTQNNISFQHSGNSYIRMIYKWIPPIFWYFAIALGIPVLNKAHTNNFEKFMEYTILMAIVCSVVIFLFCLVSIIRKYFLVHK